MYVCVCVCVCVSVCCPCLCFACVWVHTTYLGSSTFRILVNVKHRLNEGRQTDGQTDMPYEANIFLHFSKYFYRHDGMESDSTLDPRSKERDMMILSLLFSSLFFSSLTILRILLIYRIVAIISFKYYYYVHYHYHHCCYYCLYH